MTLQLEQIILLKYLTKYNIKAIKLVAESALSFDENISRINHDYQIGVKDYKAAVDLKDLALEKLYFYGITAITYADEKYPDQLRSIPDSPPVLYCKGNLQSKKNLAAVVGSREVSKYAKKITHQLVDWLNEADYGVVSGLALGIDTLAHEKAVHNKQYTIAVLPQSLEAIYPTSNYRLANDIVDAGGCLVSEMIFNINRGSQSFVQRNRIQAGLSQIVIPVEMGISSGTMHTVNFAKRYSKLITIFRPTPMLSSLENYIGINHLIEKPHMHQKVFTDKSSFMEICLSENNEKKII